jgi:hypothetical protein
MNANVIGTMQGVYTESDISPIYRKRFLDTYKYAYPDGGFLRWSEEHDIDERYVTDGTFQDILEGMATANSIRITYTYNPTFDFPHRAELHKLHAPLAGSRDPEKRKEHELTTGLMYDDIPEMYFRDFWVREELSFSVSALKRSSLYVQVLALFDALDEDKIAFGTF